MKKFVNAFTLAETMIVIVVLGIIATLTIPALVNKNKESVAKTKLRKAMAAYESAINKMIIENDLKSDTALTEWGNITNCTNSTNYFKKSKDINGCIFKTSDGVWWNISDIERPLIAFKQDDLTTEKANAENDYSAFVLVGRFGNDGSLRVDDLAYETANSIPDTNGNESKAQVEKLYTLLGMKKASSGNEASEYTFATERQKYFNGDYSTVCEEELRISCTRNYYAYGNYNFDVYDDNGKNIISGTGCDINYENCRNYIINDNTLFAQGCNSNLQACAYYEYKENKQTDNGYMSIVNTYKDEDKNEHQGTTIWFYTDENHSAFIYNMSGCSIEGTNCQNCSGTCPKPDENGYYNP